MTWENWLYEYGWENYPDLDIGYDGNNKIVNSLDDYLVYKNGSVTSQVYLHDTIVAGGTYMFA